MRNIKFHSGLFAFTLFLFYVLIVMVVWRQIFQQLDEDRRQTIASAVLHHNNLVFALEQNTIRTLQEADLLLKLTKREIERSGKSLPLDDFINEGIRKSPVFGGLAVIDRTGTIVNAYPEHLKEQNIRFSGRQHFSIHQTFPDTLFISKPLLSSSLKKPVLVISRRVNDKNGAFAGTVALQILPSAFMAFYKNASLGEDDILSLIAPDGVTYSRRTGSLESSGENIRKSPLFAHLRENASGSYFSKDAIRQIPSFFSYRKLAAYPVIATVGSSESDILSNFTLRQKREYAFGGILSGLLLVLCLYVFFSFLQRRKAVKSLVSSEARYRSIFDGSDDAIFLLSPCGKIEAMNPAAKKLFPLKTYSHGTGFHALLAANSLSAGFFNDIGHRQEVRFQPLDGPAFTGEIAASHFFDAHQQKHLLLVIRDVSLRKRMEKKLAREKKRHQSELTQHMMAAQEKEREIIGRELHDNVNQILTSVKLFLETALASPNERTDLVERSVHYVAQSIDEIRTLSHRLSGLSAGRHSLADALGELAENIRSCSPMRVEVAIGYPARPLSKEQSLAFYRIAQEQLTNVVKHADASALTIALRQTAEKTILVVKDNGRGFSPGDGGGGIGFQNMQFRARAFGGELTIHSKPGEGCELVVQLPFDNNPDQAEEVGSTTDGPLFGQ